MPRTIVVAAAMMLLVGCASTDREADAPETEPDATEAPATTTMPTTTMAPTTTAPPKTTYALTVTLFDEERFRPLSDRQCSRATNPGKSFDNVPSATYSLVDQTNNIIGILFPVVEQQPGCTFAYTGEFEMLPDLLLIRGPRMQQNGFPVRRSDWAENRAVAGQTVTLLVDLSLSVNTDWLD